MSMLKNIDMYKDDGLGVFQQTCSIHIERPKKNVTKIFNDIGFKRTIDIDTISNNFLDKSLDLLTNKHQVYSKPNSKTTRINKHSNHTTVVKKQLTKMVESRLSDASKNEDTFNTTKNVFQTALKCELQL